MTVLGWIGLLIGIPITIVAFIYLATIGYYGFLFLWASWLMVRRRRPREVINPEMSDQSGHNP